MYLRGVHLSNATKQDIVNGLAMAFESGRLKILNDPILTGELQAYEMQQLPSGLMRYSAPSGLHDDCVVALALAWSVANEAQGMNKLADFLKARNGGKDKP